MEGDQQIMVSSFLEIAVGQTADTARQFLQATSWKLEEAIQLFYIGNDGGAAVASSPVLPVENDGLLPGSSENHVEPGNVKQDDGSEVRAPLPVKRDVLYDGPPRYRSSRMGYSPNEARTVVPFRNFNEELKHPGVWEEDKGATSSKADTSRDNRNLATMYRPPFALMYHGPFEKAKEAAKNQNRWLLVNLQSTREFSSHMLNRDTWANEAVAQTITSNFIFWQVCDDTEDGSKINTYYKLETVPVTLVIDPITGQKMRSWRGMIQPEELLQDLLQFMDGSPRDHHFTLSHKRKRENSQAPPSKLQATQDHAPAVVGNGKNEEDKDTQLAQASSIETTVADSSVEPSKDTDAVNTENEIPKSEKITYPPLPEEPKGDRSLLCRVGVRLPDGRRLQRNFFRSDPIQLLWSFCLANLEGSDEKAFRLTNAIPGVPVPYDLVVPIRRSLEALSARFFNHPNSLGYCSYYGKKFDPEPGRCRRTDGKKWRCAKDAYPDSKYCERHMHRGRNRSRKPVESQTASQSLSTAVSQVTTVSSTGGNRSYQSLGSGSFQNSNLYSNSNSGSLDFGSNVSKLQLNASTYGLNNNNFRFDQGLTVDVDDRNYSSGASSARGLGMESNADSTWRLVPAQLPTASLMESRNDTYLQTKSPQLTMVNAFDPILDAIPVSKSTQQHCLFGNKIDSPVEPKHEQHMMRPFFDEWPEAREQWSSR